MTPTPTIQVGRIRLVRAIASITFLAALTVLAGWYFDISYLKSIIPSYPEMKPNTAVAFAITAIGLFCFTNRDRNGRWIDAAIICGVLTSLIGSLTLAEYMFSISFGIDGLLIPGSDTRLSGEIAGRMSPQAALNFALAGVALTLIRGRSFLQRVSEALSITVSIIAFASLLGHLYGAEELYGVSKYNSMAVHTGTLFFLCSFGLLAINPTSQIAKLLLSDSLGGTSIRRLLPTVVLIPTIVGWLRIIGQDRGLYDTGFGAALSVLLCVLLMFVIVLFFCTTIHESDQRRRLIEDELAGNEEKYRTLFDHSQGMICIHDLDGVLTTVNPAVLTSLGFDRDEVIGKNIRKFLSDDYEIEFTAFSRQIENEGLAHGLMPMITKSGRQIVWRYHSILVTEPGKEPYVLGHSQDVTALLKAEQELKNLSLTDDLTGLYNRRGFLTLAEQQIKLERHGRTARGLTLMFADMDGLKKVNDLHGHEAGSSAIKDLAKVFSSVLRESDLIARWGGDEFVILTIGSHDEDVDLMKNRINEKIAEFNAKNDRLYTLGCSIGVAPIPLDGNRSFESIVAEADEAMYAEKRLRKASREDSLAALLPNAPPPVGTPAFELSGIDRGA